MLQPLRLTGALTAVAVSAALLAGPTSVAAAAAAPVPAGPSSTELDQQVEQQRQLLTEREAALGAASTQAGTALETFQVAQRQSEQATRIALEQAARLVATEQATTAARVRLDGYVGSLYRTGMANRKMSLYTSVLESENPEQLFNGLGMVQRIGGNSGNALEALRRAEASQVDATARAAEADAAQQAAKTAADAARQAADDVVAQVREQVATRQEALLRTQAAAAAALEQEQARAALVAQAEAIARQRADTPDAAVDGAFVPRPGAQCQGQSTAGYSNGAIPTTALCPLWGTRGQMLRADAAAAFDEMSRSYAAVFGAPLCVGDSYRNFAEQVAVAAAKPALAARPGSSNHGWGVAVDLCDGVQDYSSPQHRWLASNSMLHGWFLPSWAQQGGSKPEPWHWEFAG